MADHHGNNDSAYGNFGPGRPDQLPYMSPYPVPGNNITQPGYPGNNYPPAGMDPYGAPIPENNPYGPPLSAQDPYAPQNNYGYPQAPAYYPAGYPSPSPAPAYPAYSPSAPYAADPYAPYAPPSNNWPAQSDPYASLPPSPADPYASFPPQADTRYAPEPYYGAPPSPAPDYAAPYYGMPPSLGYPPSPPAAQPLPAAGLAYPVVPSVNPYASPNPSYAAPPPELHAEAPIFRAIDIKRQQANSQPPYGYQFSRPEPAPIAPSYPEAPPVMPGTVFQPAASAPATLSPTAGAPTAAPAIESTKYAAPRFNPADSSLPAESVAPVYPPAVPAPSAPSAPEPAMEPPLSAENFSKPAPPLTTVLSEPAAPVSPSAPPAPSAPPFAVFSPPIPSAPFAPIAPETTQAPILSAPFAPVSLEITQTPPVPSPEFAPSTNFFAPPSPGAPATPGFNPPPAVPSFSTLPPPAPAPGFESVPSGPPAFEAPAFDPAGFSSGGLPSLNPPPSPPPPAPELHLENNIFESTFTIEPDPVAPRQHQLGDTEIFRIAEELSQAVLVKSLNRAFNDNNLMPEGEPRLISVSQISSDYYVSESGGRPYRMFENLSFALNAGCCCALISDISLAAYALARSICESADKDHPDEPVTVVQLPDGRSGQIMYIGSDSMLPAEMTCKEFLLYTQHGDTENPETESERLETLFAQLGAGNLSETDLRDLSYNKRILLLVLAAALNPNVVCVMVNDPNFSVGSEEEMLARRIFALINNRGKCSVISCCSEHLMASVANRVAVVKNGRLLFYNSYRQFLDEFCLGIMTFTAPNPQEIADAIEPRFPGVNVLCKDNLVYIVRRPDSQEMPLEALISDVLHEGIDYNTVVMEEKSFAVACKEAFRK